MTLGLALWAALAAPAPTEDAQPAASGRTLFEDHCSACHQYDDQGMGEAPPLEGAPWVVGPPERLVLIVLHGVKGRIELGGRTYDREMPGFGRSLSDSQVAALVTYTRSRFGADEPEVTTRQVTRTRKQHEGRTEYWLADELLRFR